MTKKFEPTLSDSRAAPSLLSCSFESEYSSRFLSYVKTNLEANDGFKVS